MDGFDRAMKDQKEKSRSVISFKTASDAYKNFTSAMDRLPEFIGYNTLTCQSVIQLLVVEGQAVETAEAGQQLEVVTAQTPFYAESGGQVGDMGQITGPIAGQGFVIEIANTIKDPTGLIIHKGRVVSGAARTGETVTLSVDPEKRAATEANHTATHLLHAALRQILGDHVRQAGSHVSSERLRFDFTHFSGVDAAALDAVEVLVNDRIRDNIAVNITEMAADEAFKTGAMALFEEKYGDVVRVITLDNFSKELCGGCHTGLTGNIGLFKIVGESSVASGVRRIEALTGAVALRHMQSLNQILHDASGIVKDRPEGLVGRISALLSGQKALEKELEKVKSQLAARSTDNLNEDIREINGVKVVAKKVAVESPAALRDLADKFKDKIASGIVVLGAEKDGKALLISIVTKDLVGRFHAGNIIKAVAFEVGGGGGGRPDMAQAGGSKPEHLDAAMEKVYGLVEAA
jgi:alanyl-tRNA synthetase